MGLADFGLSNEYARNARLKPALLVGLPLALLAATLGLRTSVMLGALAGPLAAVGLTLLLAHIGRDWGSRKQAKLFRLWGGKPSVQKLRHRDESLNVHTRARYHAKAKALLWQAMPTAAEEAADPAAADSLYEAFSNLLIERTRDTKVFRLLFEELIGYGFRRNLFGMKRLGVSIAALSSAVQALLLLGEFRATGRVEPSDGVFFAVDVLLLLCWLFVIRADWVRRSAEAYAERLLAASETLSVARATAAHARSAKRGGSEESSTAKVKKRSMKVVREGQGS